MSRRHDPWHTRRWRKAPPTWRAEEGGITDWWVVPLYLVSLSVILTLGYGLGATLWWVAYLLH